MAGGGRAVWSGQVTVRRTRCHTQPQGHEAKTMAGGGWTVGGPVRSGPGEVKSLEVEETVWGGSPGVRRGAATT